MGPFIEALTECPCENCICVPICRNRRFIDLLTKCKLAGDYLYDTEYFSSGHRRDFFDERIQRIEVMLNPDRWTVSDITEIKKLSDYKYTWKE